MSDVYDRIFEEHDQLSQRIDKLKEFLVSDKIDALPDYERNDLRLQLEHMEAYMKVLRRRCSRQCGNA